jgi:hypothetical protein
MYIPESSQLPELWMPTRRSLPVEPGRPYHEMVVRRSGRWKRQNFGEYVHSRLWLVLDLLFAGTLNKTKKGVLRVTVPVQGMLVNIGWFEKTRVYRVFENREEGSRATRTDYATPEGAARHVWLLDAERLR